MSGVCFGHEKLAAYTVSVEFLHHAVAIARKLPRSKGQSGDQLQRASESICLRIAEGAGLDIGSAEQRRHYRAARASALECASILDVARAWGVISDECREEGRILLDRVVRLLSGLAPRR